MPRCLHAALAIGITNCVASTQGGTVAQREDVVRHAQTHAPHSPCLSGHAATIGAWHHREHYANTRIEAGHRQLKRRPRPMRGLKLIAEPRPSSRDTCFVHTRSEPPSSSHNKKINYAEALDLWRLPEPAGPVHATRTPGRDQQPGTPYMSRRRPILHDEASRG